LRALAIAGAHRSPKLPDVPTAPEAGFPELLSPFWLGVVAPAGTTPAIIDKLNAAFRESLAHAETRALLDKLGAEIKIGTPAEFEKMLADERAKWTAVVKAANIKVD
jgi:tripartite-type tricarboxylate transporter receptor subunit TctC